MGCTRNVLALTRELAPGRRLVLTVTHAHPEHGFGAQVFKPDAEIFGTLDELGRRGVTIVAGPLEYEPIRRRGGFFANPWGKLTEIIQDA
jgi:glyoxylase-like metal-dependent hydrolase (beta-lactamase superfamily II)